MTAMCQCRISGGRLSKLGGRLSKQTKIQAEAKTNRGWWVGSLSAQCAFLRMRNYAKRQSFIDYKSTSYIYQTPRILLLLLHDQKKTDVMALSRVIGLACIMVLAFVIVLSCVIVLACIIVLAIVIVLSRVMVLTCSVSTCYGVNQCYGVILRGGRIAYSSRWIRLEKKTVYVISWVEELPLPNFRTPK